MQLNKNIKNEKYIFLLARKFCMRKEYLLHLAVHVMHTTLEKTVQLNLLGDVKMKLLFFETVHYKLNDFLCVSFYVKLFFVLFNLEISLNYLQMILSLSLVNEVHFFQNLFD